LIFVLAGVNGAGKSCVGGSAIRAQGQDWYNPDEAARRMSERYPDRPLEEIHSQVWHEGLRRLKAAIRDNINPATIYIVFSRRVLPAEATTFPRR